jgi:hypothetical protein
VSEWISVKDRLPDHHDMVLVWKKSSGSEPDWPTMAFWARIDGWGWTFGDGNKANDIWGTVTHWMPLPDGPK